MSLDASLISIKAQQVFLSLLFFVVVVVVQWFVCFFNMLLFFLGLVCSVLILGFHLIYLYFLVSYFIILNHKILE